MDRIVPDELHLAFSSTLPVRPTRPFRAEPKALRRLRFSRRPDATWLG
jgi:hypothetical protein